MIPWIIQISIISLILIILVHYLFTFFMTNLTIPKVKDLVNKPQQQYETLYNTMKEQPILKQKGNENMTNENMTNESMTNENMTNENMKNELKNYLKELSDNTSTSNNSNSNSNSNNSNSNNSNNSNNNNSNINNNVNNLGGLLTGESFGNSGSFGSSSYSTF